MLPLPQLRNIETGERTIMANYSNDIITVIAEQHGSDIVLNEIKAWKKYNSLCGTKTIYVAKTKTGVLSEVHLGGFDADLEVGAPPKGKLGKIRRVIKCKQVDDAVILLQQLTKAFEALTSSTVSGDKGLKVEKEDSETKTASVVLDYEAVAALQAKKLEEEMGLTGEFEDEADSEDDVVYADGRV